MACMMTSPELNRRIFLVEDDRGIREAFEEFLVSEGYEVESAIDGQDGLAKLRAVVRGGRVPALILLDLMMPVKDGTEFRKEQRQDPEINQIPVVVMSADTRVAQKAELIGVAEHLKKPVELEDLLTLLQKYV